jgi:cytochrome c oxidase cbb3-type subunit II
MKNGPLFFVGILVSLVASWGAIVVGSTRQLGRLEQHFDSLEGLPYPQAQAGVAAQGAQVYASLGCAECHTQQVRRPNFGYDKTRGWGERQSVARDYLLQKNVHLGQIRRGPDLSNYADRAAKAGFERAKLLEYLYKEHAPRYDFLFETRSVQGAALASAIPAKVPAGRQVVAGYRAEALVSYLLSLKQEYVYPEAQPPESAEEAKN